jgi:tetratricopeptide (TPR) repeat protein
VLGDDRLQEFLVARLSVVKVPAWYGYLADFLWYRIYTTNIDNVLEEGWKPREKERPRLVPILGTAGNYVDRDQLLRIIQCIKLNGSLEAGVKGITFSRRQYAARFADEDIWVDHFVRDYFEHPTIFVGTELDEPVLWSYIERRERIERERGRQDPRPKGLLIAPNISPAREPLLESLHIEPVRATAREFFETLHQELRDAQDVEQVLRRTLFREGFPAHVTNVVTRGIRHHLVHFHNSFREVRPRAKSDTYHGFYLLGSRPTWDDLAAELDAEREITAGLEGLIRKAVSDPREPRLIFLRGAAGSGKSTVLMRLAFKLKQQGFACFFGEGESVPETRDVRVAAESYDTPLVLCLDNAHKHLWTIAEWTLKVSKLRHPPVFVCACRTNQFERNVAALSSVDGYVTVDMHDLNDTEIHVILDILEREQQLGELRGVSKEDRVRMFREFARRQLLVGMREATAGKGFDEIIADEFARLSPEAQLIYVIVALPSFQHHSVKRSELLAASPYPLERTIEILNRSLLGIVIETEQGRGVYQARHPVIAEMIVNSVAARGVLSDAYGSYLRAIAHEVPPNANRKSRTWQIFWRLLNHQNLYRQFGNVEYARRIYESLKNWFGAHGHFWLQYGALELEYGHLDSAENYINQARTILGEKNIPVMSTYGHLLMKLANRTPDLDEGVRLREEGEKILRAQIASASRSDPYPYHILGTQMLGWLHRVEDRQERKSGYERLIRIIEEAVQIHPGRQELRDLLNDIRREYLMLAAV